MIKRRTFITTLALGAAAKAADIQPAGGAINRARIRFDQAGFSPTQVSDLTFWLNAPATPGANGDAIASVADASGSGNTATQGTAAAKPTLKIWNGVRRLYFDGGDSLVTPSFLDSSYNTALTVFVLSEPINGLVYFRISGSHSTLFFSSGDAATTDFNGFFSHTPLSVDESRTPIVITNRALEVFRYNGTTITTRRNGSQTTAAATGNHGLNGSLTIGAYAPGGLGWIGWIDQYLIYKRALSDAEILQVEAAIAYTTSVGTRASGAGTRQVACDGNSLTQGAGGQTPYPTQLATLLGAGWNVVNYGVGGQEAWEMSNDATTTVDTQFALSATKCVSVAWEGIIGLRLQTPVEVVYAHLVDYCRGRRMVGWQVLVLTVLPSSGTGTPVGFEAARLSLNTLIRTNWATFADGLVDVTTDARIGDPGDELDTTYYLDEAGLHVHLTTAGYAIIAEAVQAAIAALP